MTPREQLEVSMMDLLDNCNISVDEKIKALGVVRNHLNRATADPSLEKWRQERDARGAIGVPKKPSKGQSD